MYELILLPLMYFRISHREKGKIRNLTSQLLLYFSWDFVFFFKKNDRIIKQNHLLNVKKCS